MVLNTVSFTPSLSNFYLTVFIADPESTVIAQNKTFRIYGYPLGTWALSTEAVTGIYKSQRQYRA